MPTRYSVAAARGAKRDFNLGLASRTLLIRTPNLFVWPWPLAMPCREKPQLLNGKLSIVPVTNGTHFATAFSISVVQH